MGGLRESRRSADNKCRFNCQENNKKQKTAVRSRQSAAVLPFYRYRFVHRRTLLRCDHLETRPRFLNTHLNSNAIDLLSSRRNVRRK